MALRQIVTIKDEEVLRKHSKIVTDFNERLWKLLDDMKQTLDKADGVGLAAPQVGILKRVAIVNCEEQFFELVNPTITYYSDETETMEEGCLSVPGEYAPVTRPLTIKFNAFDRNGQPYEAELSGFIARAVQHECDHLDGILYIDKVDKK